MIIRAQQNMSEPIALSKNLTLVRELAGTLREDCSIIDPVIVVEGSLSDLAQVNYFTIPAFGRSYFVTGSPESLGGDFVLLRGHVDVLSSFAAQIRENSAVVRRQEHDWNLYVNDDVIKSYANPLVTTVEFPSGFSGASYVLLVAGKRGDGMQTGAGGYVPGSTGVGNSNSKTTAGLIAYAHGQLGRPYWFGTYGQTADQQLLDAKRQQYPDSYPNPGDPAFSSQFGQRVHDCVGLVKGYLWSSGPDAQPVPSAAQDVNVRGLFAQCTAMRGTIDRTDLSTIPTGAIMFYSSMEHCGVYIGNGKLIEARGHAYGVVQSNLADRTSFAKWGIPDWMQLVPSYSLFAPTITQQPVDITAAVNTTATFTIVATGYQLTYQWQYKQTPDQTEWSNVTAESGQTANYSLTVRSRHNGYTYRCVVTQAGGSSVTSDVVTLTVTDA